MTIVDRQDRFFKNFVMVLTLLLKVDSFVVVCEGYSSRTNIKATIRVICCAICFDVSSNQSNLFRQSLVVNTLPVS